MGEGLTRGSLMGSSEMKDDDAEEESCSAPLSKATLIAADCVSLLLSLRVLFFVCKQKTIRKKKKKSAKNARVENRKMKVCMDVALCPVLRSFFFLSKVPSTFTNV